MKTRAKIAVFIFLFSLQAAYGESFRALVAGVHKISLSEGEELSVPLSYVSSSVIELDGDVRFFRGIQLELSVPQSYLSHRGSLGAALYGNLTPAPDIGIADVEGSRLGFEPLPAKIKTIYQIPLKARHGLRTSPYVTVLTEILDHSAFPLLFRIMPVIKGISYEVENMTFHLTVKPILSDEGAFKINFSYPENLPGRPLQVLIDDVLIENPEEERLLKEGEHHLVILSEDYRNQSTRFVVERAKTLELAVELLDPTPLVFFEFPEETRVYLNGAQLPDPHIPRPVEPGIHELRFELSDYTITRPLTVQKGRTYRVALSVDITVSETE